MYKLLSILLVGILFSCNPTDSSTHEETLVNNFKFKPNSIEVRYFEGTQDTFQIMETDRLGDSHFLEFYPNGQLKVSGLLSKGVKYNEWRTYYLQDQGEYIYENIDSKDYGFRDTIIGRGLTIKEFEVLGFDKKKPKRQFIRYYDILGNIVSEKGNILMLNRFKKNKAKSLDSLWMQILVINPPLSHSVLHLEFIGDSSSQRFDIQLNHEYNSFFKTLIYDPTRFNRIKGIVTMRTKYIKIKDDTHIDHVIIDSFETKLNNIPYGQQYSNLRP